MTEWISVEDRLPEVVEINGCCNFVLVRYRDRFSPECGSEYQTSNTIYVNAHPEKFTHWMPIPEPPTD
ncbi:MAG TPA: DUF551 domain-containing protein [Candidatus Woesebacteria bacterium]|nr:DUF551 domain-containing protein [Candidatus Woesebacteria bacterium]